MNIYYKIWSSAYDSVLNMTKYKTAVAGEIFKFFFPLKLSKHFENVGKESIKFSDFSYFSEMFFFSHNNNKSWLWFKLLGAKKNFKFKPSAIIPPWSWGSPHAFQHCGSLGYRRKKHHCPESESNRSLSVVKNPAISHISWKTSLFWWSQHPFWLRSRGTMTGTHGPWN